MFPRSRFVLEGHSTIETRVSQLRKRLTCEQTAELEVQWEYRAWALVRLGFTMMFCPHHCPLSIGVRPWIEKGHPKTNEW
jgi:hypothetical protein